MDPNSNYSHKTVSYLKIQNLVNRYFILHRTTTDYARIFNTNNRNVSTKKIICGCNQFNRMLNGLGGFQQDCNASVKPRYVTLYYFNHNTIKTITMLFCNKFSCSLEKS